VLCRAKAAGGPILTPQKQRLVPLSDDSPRGKFIGEAIGDDVAHAYGTPIYRPHDQAVAFAQKREHALAVKIEGAVRAGMQHLKFFGKAAGARRIHTK
jgi:hypothetical protein